MIKLIRLRCLTRKCGWVGYMDESGHLTGQNPKGEWALTYCPRCKGTYAEYA